MFILLVDFIVLTQKAAVELVLQKRKYINISKPDLVVL